MGTLINILGAERTGSTMMDVVLGNDQNAFSCGEVMYWFRPYRKHNFKLDCVCGDTNCVYWKEYRDAGQRSFHNMVLNEYQFSIDSSKNLIWVIDNISYLDKSHKVFNIVMWKNLEKLIYSHWKRGNNIEKYVSNYFDYYKKLLECGLPFVSVNYDDFICEPDTILENLCKMTGMQYSPSKLDFWNGEHHFLFGSHGVRQQVFNRSSYIYKDETSSKGYDSVLENQDLSFLNKIPVEEITKEIKKRNILDKPSSNIEHSSTKINKPYWYYIRRLKRSLRRYFPADHQVKNVNHVYGEAPRK